MVTESAAQVHECLSAFSAAMVVLSVPLAIAGLIIIVISEFLYIHQKMEGGWLHGGKESNTFIIMKFENVYIRCGMTLLPNKILTNTHFYDINL